MMPTRLSPTRQDGAVLIVSLIMLMLITMFVITAYKYSSTNLKSVGNMQSRAEAIAAGNKAMEQVIGSWDFSSPPSADQISVDIDNNGSDDFIVDIAPPVCIKAVVLAVPRKLDSEFPTDNGGLTGSPQTSGPGVAPLFNVLWELDATVTNSSGTRVRMRQGISQSISQDQCSAACPPAGGGPCA